MTALQPPPEVDVRHEPPAPARRRRPGTTPGWLVLIVAVALAASPLAYGYFAPTIWAPLGLGAMILLVPLAIGARRSLDGAGITAATGIGLLMILSFASLTWAESRDAAWAAANLTTVYTVVFAIGVLGIRARVPAWATLVLLGVPGLVTATVLTVEFVTGGGGGAFIGSRLTGPMGYANATAALLVMGVWPWLGLAERLAGRAARTSALAAASLIAGTAALTQTRAILLAAGLSIVLALLVAPGRARRCLNLLIVLAAAAAASPWTLAVYRSTAPTHLSAPGGPVLRGAGLALLGAAMIAGLLGWLADATHARARLRRRVDLPGAWTGRALPALAIAALLVGGLAARGPLAVQWHDFTTLNDERSANNRYLALGGGPRYDLWRIAVDEFAAAPLGGVGAGNYADQEYRLRHGLEHVSNPHSLELQTLAELGIAGVLGLLLFVGPVLAAGLSGSWRRLAGADPAMRVAALGVFSAWLAGASVDWLYEIPGLTGMAMLAAGLLLAPAAGAGVAETAAGGEAGAGEATGGRAAMRRATRSALRGRAPAAALLLALALAAASIGRQYGATLYTDAGGSLVRAAPLRALAKLRTAEQLDPWSMPVLYDVAAAYARLDDYNGARAALVRAQQLEPENYVPSALLGDIATRAGKRAVARADYRRALRLDPLEPALRRAIAAVGPGRRPAGRRP